MNHEEEASRLLCIPNLRLPFEAGEEAALEKARRLAHAPGAPARILRRAVDARRPDDIRFVYTVGLFLSPKEEAALSERIPGAKTAGEEAPALVLPRGTRRLPARPVVAGFGPAGMFCALLLAERGLRPLVLERGAAMEERVAAAERFWRGGPFDPDANVQFGEGGAGTFSDGKLTTRISDPRCRWVLEQFVRFGAPEDILVSAKPHIGTDLLRGVVRRLRDAVTAAGGEVRFRCPVRSVVLRDGAVHAVGTPQGEVPAPVLVCALGHSARDSFTMLHALGIAMEAKPFSVGVRIEHRQADVDRALYGRSAGHPLLPPGEYQLSYREGGRGVYTFCMCPGGVVVPAASADGETVVNGMSVRARDGENANAALVVGVGPEDFGTGPLDGMCFQQRLEAAAFRDGFPAPVQTAGRFLEGKPGAAFGGVRPTYARGVYEAGFDDILPPLVCAWLRTGLRRFGQRQRGFDSADTVLTGVETRTSSPVRILRGEGLEAGAAGLYPCGEGAGYAGGIVSAAVDGVRVAERILAQYAPF